MQKPQGIAFDSHYQMYPFLLYEIYFIYIQNNIKPAF